MNVEIHVGTIVTIHQTCYVVNSIKKYCNIRNIGLILKATDVKQMLQNKRNPKIHYVGEYVL